MDVTSASFPAPARARRRSSKKLSRFFSRYKVAVLFGDLATENDAIRSSRSQAAVKQIITGTVCHLEVAIVQKALDGWNLRDLDFLYIENVGTWYAPLPKVSAKICELYCLR